MDCQPGVRLSPHTRILSLSLFFSLVLSLCLCVSFYFGSAQWPETHARPRWPCVAGYLQTTSDPILFVTIPLYLLLSNFIRHPPILFVTIPLYLLPSRSICYLQTIDRILLLWPLNCNKKLYILSTDTTLKHPISSMHIHFFMFFMHIPPPPAQRWMCCRSRPCCRWRPRIDARHARTSTRGSF